MFKCTKCKNDKPEDQYAVAYNKRRRTVCMECDSKERRVCKACGVEYDLQIGFYLNQNGHYRQECIECAKGRAKKHYFTNRDMHGERQYWWRVKHTYGVTREEVEAMNVAQEGKCAICDEPFKPGKRPDIDHCHDTGKVRGLLCSSCNRGIGQLKDNVQVLRSAIEYLERNSITKPIKRKRLKQHVKV